MSTRNSAACLLGVVCSLGAASALATEVPESSWTFDEQVLYSSEFQVAQNDTSANSDLAAAESVGAPVADAPLSAECAAFAKDKHADLGDVLKAGCEPTLEQMSALMDNPLGNVAMMFNQFDQYFLENDANDKSAIQSNYMALLQFPKAISEDWNIINRLVFNVASSPLDQDKIDDAGGIAPCSPVPGGGAPSCEAPIDAFDGRTTGLGDSYYVGLFSPKKGIQAGEGSIVWGAGFDVMAPTATDDVLGTGKWGAGPSALGVYLGPKWKLGALAQHYWDVAGSDNRADVNLTNLQYFYMRSINSTTSIGAAPNIIINWENDGTDRFTIPVGLGMNKTFQMGKVPVRFGAELYYSVWKPNNIAATEWNLRFYVIPAAPSALFGWMQ